MTIDEKTAIKIMIHYFDKGKPLAGISQLRQFDISYKEAKRIYDKIKKERNN